MRPYGLRRSIRCPKKYGEHIKERTNIWASSDNQDLKPKPSEEDPQKPLDVRYTRNAAVLPDLRPPHSDEPLTFKDKDSVSGPTSQAGPLMIHGYTVPEYQHTYHLVVDPLLCAPCGGLTAYSLQLGRTIKEHLFEKLAYPMLQITELPNGKVEVMERFCVLRPTPYIDIDSKGEPSCHSRSSTT